MKFLCPNCKAKYQISDEKVSGRTLKMDCRRCEHPIVIRGDRVESARPSRRSSGGAGVKSRASAPSSSPRASRRSRDSDSQRESLAPERTSELERWHAAINDVPVGPMKRDELVKKMRSGAITGASLVWREGLEDWRPLRDVPELAALLLRSRRPPPPPSRSSRRGGGSGRVAPPSRPLRPPRSGSRPGARDSAGGSSAARASGSNVVPISGRLSSSAAEKLAPDHDFLDEDEPTRVGTAIDFERLERELASEPAPAREPEPPEAAPAEASPDVAEPVAAEPVAAEPVAAEPVAAEPVAAEPVAAEPVAALGVAPSASVSAPPAPVASQSVSPEMVGSERLSVPAAETEVTSASIPPAQPSSVEGGERPSGDDELFAAALVPTPSSPSAPSSTESPGEAAATASAVMGSDVVSASGPASGPAAGPSDEVPAVAAAPVSAESAAQPARRGLPIGAWVAIAGAMAFGVALAVILAPRLFPAQPVAVAPEPQTSPPSGPAPAGPPESEPDLGLLDEASEPGTAGTGGAASQAEGSEAGSPEAEGSEEGSTEADGAEAEGSEAGNGAETEAAGAAASERPRHAARTGDRRQHGADATSHRGRGGAGPRGAQLDESTRARLAAMASDTTEIAAVQRRSSPLDERGDDTGTSLTADQIRRVVNAGRSGVQRCYETAIRAAGRAPTIRLDVQVNVAAGGTVTRVDATSSQAIGDLERCVEGTVRRWRFPRSGAPTATNIPFVFSGTE